MIYELYSFDTTKLNWKAKDEERILQNVRNLISTFRYEVGYDRTKGVDPNVLDKKMDEALALYISEVYRLVETYEPRAKVISVTPTSATVNGNLVVKVVVEI